MNAKSQMLKIVNSAFYASVVLSMNQGIYAMDVNAVNDSLTRDLQPIHEVINRNSDLKREVDGLDAYQEQKFLPSPTLEETQTLAEQYFEDAWRVGDNLKRQAYIIKSFLLRHDAAKKADKNAKKEYISCLGIFFSSISHDPNINPLFGGEKLLESVSQKLLELGEEKSPEMSSSGSSSEGSPPLFSSSSSPSSPTLSRSRSTDSLLPHKKRKTDKD